MAATVKNPKTLTIKQMASGLGVSTATIDDYVSRGCPRTSIEAAQEWRSINVKSRNRPENAAEVTIECQRAEIAERLENARARQMKNAALIDRTVPVHEVQSDTKKGLEILTLRLRKLPAKVVKNVAPELSEVIRNEVKATIDLAMQTLRNDIEHLLKH